jgi:hypothetical protein
MSDTSGWLHVRPQVSIRVQYRGCPELRDYATDGGEGGVDMHVARQRPGCTSRKTVHVEHDHQPAACPPAPAMTDPDDAGALSCSGCERGGASYFR